MLTGESKRLYEIWKLEGLSFEKRMTKLKEYARCHTLDGEANKGKKPVDMNMCQGDEGKGEEEETEEEPGTVNKLGQLRW